MREDAALLFGFLGFFFLIGWVIWVVATNIQRNKTAKARAEVQAKLLDRFGSSHELLEYMQSDAGKRLIESATIERTNPFGRILGSVQVGLILLCLGAAFLLLRLKVPDPDAALLVFGAMGLALGSGFLLAAAVS